MISVLKMYALDCFPYFDLTVLMLLQLQKAPRSSQCILGWKLKMEYGFGSTPGERSSVKTPKSFLLYLHIVQ